MSNATERKFNVGDTVYVLEQGLKFTILWAPATIQDVDEKNKTFYAAPYDDDDLYQKYDFSDYGHVFFDTKEEASETLRKLPQINQTVYRIINNRVYKRICVGFLRRYSPDSHKSHLFIRLNIGKVMPSINEMGITLFLSKEEARSNKKK